MLQSISLLKISVPLSIKLKNASGKLQYGIQKLYSRLLNANPRITSKLADPTDTIKFSQ